MAICEWFYLVKNSSIQMMAEQDVDHQIIIMESIYKVILMYSFVLFAYVASFISRENMYL